MGNKGTILSVDDDENLQFVVQQYLEGDGYNVITALDGKALETKLSAANHIDVILLDLMLPDNDGLSLIRLIRQHSKTPIIVVSGKSDTTEKIICLEMGADDYLTKPFEMRELSARIKAVIRRTVPDETQDNAPEKRAGAKSEKILFNDFCLDRTQFQLFDKNNQSVELTTGEFKLLEALVLAPNRVLSREYLFTLTRDSEYDSYDRAIDIQIARLRKKLGDDPRSPSLIKTVRGVGYMFNGDIQSTDA